MNIKNPPAKIFLVTGIDENEFDIEDFKDLHELTWSTSKEFYHDIEYVLATPPQQVVEDEDYSSYVINVAKEADDFARGLGVKNLHAAACISFKAGAEYTRNQFKGYTREQMEGAHMAGQANAGIDPSASEALAYLNSLTNTTP